MSDLATKCGGNTVHHFKTLAVQIKRHRERFTQVLPFLPSHLLSLGSRVHSFIDDPTIVSSYITLDTAGVSRKSFKEFCWGSRKVALKKVRNPSSFSKCQAGLFPNGRAGMSPRWLRLLIFARLRGRGGMPYLSIFIALRL